MTPASIKIIDELTAIKVELGSFTRTIPKDSSVLIDTDAGKDELLIHSSTLEDKILRVKFPRVVDPVTANLEALRVAVKDMLAVGGAGSATAAGQALQLVKLTEIEFNTLQPLQVDGVGGGITYIGYAVPGTLTSVATWAISKITESGSDVTIEWADGDKSFDNEWDDRLSLAYS